MPDAVHGISISEATMMHRRGLLSLIGSLPFFGWAKTEAAPRVVVKTPYATEGEAITCENGHYICDFVQTVYEGDIQNVEEQLGNWQQTKPKLGVIPLPCCEKCGAQWTLGVIYHIEGGWRDPHGLIEKYGMLDH
jgi:hypothetical protein